MAEQQLPKLNTRVRFPSPAPNKQAPFRGFFYLDCGDAVENPRQGSVSRKANVAQGKARATGLTGEQSELSLHPLYNRCG